MKKLLLAGAFTSLVSSLSYADSYQSQVGVSLGKIEDIKIYNITGSLYFSPVDDSIGPYREAAFLNKASDVTVLFNKFDTDFGSVDNKSLSTHVVFADRMFVDGAYSTFEEEDTLTVGFGAYLSDLLTASVFYTDIDSSFDDSSSSYGFVLKGLNGTGDSGIYAYGINLIRSEASFGNEDISGTDIIASMTYYITKAASLGITHHIHDIAETDSTTLEYMHFINSNIALSLNYSFIKDKEVDESFNGYNLGAQFRF